METGRESEVVAAFTAWLRREGWDVRTEVEWADVVADRSGERLIAEAKGVTTAAGLDVDTMYGQLLRRMVPDEQVRYAVVVPASIVSKAERVPTFVRQTLRIEVYGVGTDGTVTVALNP